MRILTIGGTQFIGRHFVRAALDGGHEVTIFHRGRTGAGLFLQATHLTGDRDQDLGALAAGRWDATVDFCAYRPGQVRALAAALGGRGGQHVLISSVSAYRTPAPSGFGEDWPLAELADPEVQEVTDATYGGLKAACERAALDAYGRAATTIIRPTYVIGPYDHSYRLTWWVERLARGGRVLAPGDPADPIQVIDARDLAAWLLDCAQARVTGIFDAVGPVVPLGAWVEQAREIGGHTGPVTAAGADWLLEQGVGQWMGPESLPMWIAEPGWEGFAARSGQRARAAGLVHRPRAELLTDVLAWERDQGLDRPRRAGLTAGRERELLAALASA